MVSKVPITKNGYDNLVEELRRLKQDERPSVVRAIAEARQHGDLSENAEYHAAREKQGFLEGRILELEDVIARAEVIDITKLSGDTVKFGATVTVVDEETELEQAYTIVGEYESDLTKSLISISSPLAKAMIGKKANDLIEIVTPKGAKDYTILKVEYR